MDDLQTGADRPNGGYVVVWDCESDGSFKFTPGSTHEEKIKSMQFTVLTGVVIPVEAINGNSSAEDIMAHSTAHVWWRDSAELGSNPVVSLLELFDHAELIVGYNCLGFDFPLIRRFYHRTTAFPDPVSRYLMHRSKTLDVMARVRDATGTYYKLDALLKCNGLETKTGDGLQAIRLWEDGKRSELANYCLNDVIVTAKLALLSRVRVYDNAFVSEPCVGISAALRSTKVHNANTDDYVWVSKPVRAT